MITLEHVGLTYGTSGEAHEQALSDLDLTVADHERLAIIGPSGCGKSSLLNLMAGLILPTEGVVAYNGVPLSGPHEEIGVILQEYGLFPWKTVAQNVALPLVLKKYRKSEIQTTIAPILAQLGLTEQRDKLSGQLSGGQRQRVAIARVLAMAPQVLLMDEPFSALDALTRESLQNIVLALCREQGLTLVMVTHNIEEAVFLGEKILVFGQDQGRVAHLVVNGHSGQPTYRNTAEFYQQCRMLRALIRGDDSEK